MAQELLIVHGYSDGYIERNDVFERLETWLVDTEKLYTRGQVHYVEYASMDDQSTYQDFADKLNADYERKIGAGNRVDVLCHSTGALVTRVWLASRRRWQRERGMALDCPVDRLFMFAPANFGSDLARMGQSFLGRLRTTLFNKNAFAKDAFESGEIILKGLEPASPFQWQLSLQDLHTETYFGPDDPTGQSTYPVVFAAGNGYGGLQSKVIAARNKPGTDGTVRIAGTSLNTRKCTLWQEGKGPGRIEWHADPKHAAVAFGVFQGFNHGSILDPTSEAFQDELGPGPALLEAMKVKTRKDYGSYVRHLHAVSEANYREKAVPESKDRYQQFLIKVRDDANFPVRDYFIEFRAVQESGRKDLVLSRQLDDYFSSRVTPHSEDASLRAFLVDVAGLSQLARKLKERRAGIQLCLHAKKPTPEVSYKEARFDVYGGGSSTEAPSFFFPNTTTLVEAVLEREQSDRVLKIRESGR